MCACEPGFVCSRCRTQNERILLGLTVDPAEVEADRLERARYGEYLTPEADLDAA